MHSSPDIDPPSDQCMMIQILDAFACIVLNHRRLAMLGDTTDGKKACMYNSFERDICAEICVSRFLSHPEALILNQILPKSENGSLK